MTRTSGVAVAAVAVASCLLSACASPAPASDPVATAPTSAVSSVATPTPIPSPTPTPRESTSTAPSAEPAPVPDTLQFQATTVDGRSVDGASLAGRPVLLWFWAPWCPTCRAQTAEVQRLAKAYEGRVAVIGVGSLDGGSAITRFADDAPGLTHLTDEKGEVWKHFGVAEQSSFVLLDADGKKVFSTGYGGSKGLAAEVAAVAS